MYDPPRQNEWLMRHRRERQRDRMALALARAYCWCPDSSTYIAARAAYVLAFGRKDADEIEVREDRRRASKEGP